MRLPRLPAACGVYTPAPLASAMVSALGDWPSVLWLEPCVGQGVFLKALASRGVESHRIVAVDLDSTANHNDSLGSTIRGQEFLAWSLATDLRFDRIVGNPPYANLDQVDPLIRQAALKHELPNGSSISSGSNCWAAFVCGSLRLLRSGGSISFVLPAAWEYADYAEPLRSLLPDRFASFEVHRSRRPLFDLVQDGSVVIVGRRFGQPSESKLRFEYDSPEELIEGLTRNKANDHFVREAAVGPYDANFGNSRLGDMLNVRLGGVTGDTDYFLLTEAERAARGLPIESVRPVLSKARHLVAATMTKREWTQLRDSGERIWLFRPSARRPRHHAIGAYLRLREEAGGCHRQRYKIANRNPWYRTVLPTHVDGFMSGMAQFGPWICFRRMSRLTATNTLYTVRFSEMNSGNQRAAIALSLLSSAYREPLNRIGRLYPSGLVKYEPGDLARLPLMLPDKIEGADVLYPQAIRALLDGAPEECRRIADRWFDGH